MATARWHILGAGALGTMIALRMQQAKVEVQLLHHNSSVSERQILAEGKTGHIPVSDVRELAHGEIERLIIATKAGQVASAIRLATPALAAGALVICTANGIGFEESAEARMLDRGLLRGVTTAGAYRDSSGIVHAVAQGETRIGDPASLPQAPHWFDDSLALLEGWIWDGNINKAIGRKFALNCVINPLTAERRCRNGELLENEQPTASLRRLCAESEAILRELGYWDGGPLIDAAVDVCRTTASNQSSMLQDVLAGRATEIDFLNGALLRLAPDAALPINAALVDAIRNLPLTKP